MVEECKLPRAVSKENYLSIHLSTDHDLDFEKEPGSGFRVRDFA